MGFEDVQLVPARGERYHTCSVCRKMGKWTASWSWYGSYKDLDDGKPIIKVCSEKCRKAAGIIGAGVTG